MPDGQHPVLSTSIERLLLARGLLSVAALDRVRRLEADSGERIDRIAVKLGLVSESDLAVIYAALIGSPIVTGSDFPAAPVAIDRIRPLFLKQARMIPLSEDAAALTVAMADPLDERAAGALEFAIDKPVLRRAAVPA